MPSAVIRSMRYHPAERLLDITFRDARGVYRYFDVPLAEWEAFGSAASKGTYLNQVFKEGGYGYEKLPEARDASAAAQAGDPRHEIAVPLVWGCVEEEEG